MALCVGVMRIGAKLVLTEPDGHVRTLPTNNRTGRVPPPAGCGAYRISRQHRVPDCIGEVHRNNSTCSTGLRCKFPRCESQLPFWVLRVGIHRTDCQTGRLQTVVTAYRQMKPLRGRIPAALDFPDPSPVNLRGIVHSRDNSLVGSLPDQNRLLWTGQTRVATKLVRCRHKDTQRTILFFNAQLESFGSQPLIGPSSGGASIG